MSPNFDQDGIAFAIVKRAPAPHPTTILRTTDGGLSWKRLTNGLDARGQFTSVCISPDFANDSTVFATEAPIGTTNSVAAGVYASTDKGVSWSRISQGLPGISKLWPELSVCLIDSLGRRVLLVAGQFGGVLRTDNIGGNWTQAVGTNVRVTALAVSPNAQTNGVVVAGDDLGNIYASVDHGASWSQTAAAPNAGKIHEIALSAAGTMFVATDQHGLIMTTASGGNPVAVNAGLPDEPVTALALSPDFDQDLTLFTATANAGVFKSTDGGNSWTQFDSGIHLSDDLTSQSDYHYQTLSVSPAFSQDQTVFVSMFEGLLRSTDAGQSWFQLQTVPTNLILGLSVSPQYGVDGSVAVSQYGSSVTVSRDGGASWEPAKRGLTNPFCYDVQFSSNYANDQAIFALSADLQTTRSTDGGVNWTQSSPFLGFQGTRLAISPNAALDRTAFAGSRRDGIFRTTDGGTIWSQVDIVASRVDSLEVAPDFDIDPLVFAGRRGIGVYRSTDGGDSWAVASTGLPLDSARGPTVCISAGFLQDRRLFAATLQGLYESNDAGDSWTIVPIDGVADDSPVEEVALSPSFDVDGTLLASVRGHGLFKSVDSGASWNEVAPALIADNELFQRIRFATSQTVFAYSSTRLFRSTDGGVTWLQTPHGPFRVESHKPLNEWLLYEGSHQLIGWPKATAGVIGHLDAQGSRVRFFFFGTGAKWIGARAPFLGIAEVYVDGILQTKIDQYNASAQAVRTLYSSTGLPRGLHELSIVVGGQANASATGIGAVIDAFDFLQ